MTFGLLVGIVVMLCVSPLLLLLASKGDYIYIRGAKISSKYYRPITFMWIAGCIGIIPGLILSKIFNNQLIAKIIIIFFIFAGYLLSRRKVKKNEKESKDKGER